eukprot:CAMPEP_0171254688 /NCGR_PEP_ID=MMETSP0790-20130122/52364_1 /TAXON_ID=2925 /ORGANISM="Alexandrium catenella, Strain OF101" /LENGTH=124 /DNA_ID=CAMNT_0011722585 /DNA_START=18 /DNA_END=392 /DNA_ORIENTATION=+
MASELVKNFAKGSKTGSGALVTREVDIGYGTEKVMIDPKEGPQVLMADGTYASMSCTLHGSLKRYGDFRNGKPWPIRSSTEKEVMIAIIAKTNAATKERLGFADAFKMPSKEQVDAIKKAMAVA